MKSSLPTPSARLRRPRLLLATAALVSLVLPDLVAAQPARDIECRRRVGIVARKFVSNLTVEILACHVDRAKGLVPEALDCNTPSTWVGNGYPIGTGNYNAARANVDRIVGMCNAESPMAALGYSSCPAPCNALPIVTENDLPACIRCVTETAVTSVAAAVYGTPALPLERESRLCQERFGRQLITYFNRRSFLQDNCQFRKEDGKPGYTTVADCSALDIPAHPSYARLSAQIDKLDRLIDKRCGEVDIAGTLDLCGTTPAALKACLKSEVDAAALELFALTFPTIP